MHMIFLRYVHSIDKQSPANAQNSDKAIMKHMLENNNHYLKHDVETQALRWR